LIEMIREIGASASAQDLLDRLAEETDAIPDDMAVCLISPSEGKGSTERIEELDLERADLERYSVEAFLEACGVPAADVAAAVDSARETADSFGGATLRVSIGEQRAEVSVLPRVEDGFPIATANPPVGPPATAV
jgi:hypothetical protein